ncbi:MAG: hypothetical protein WC964_04055 [Acholeplasmataceae bacterium]
MTTLQVIGFITISIVFVVFLMFSSVLLTLFYALYQEADSWFLLCFSLVIIHTIYVLMLPTVNGLKRTQKHD